MISVVEAAALLARPEMRFVPGSVLALWEAQTDQTIRTASAGDWARVREGNLVRKALVQELHVAGARLLLGTDTPNRLVTPGFALHDELTYLVEAGLTPYEALRAGTRDAAAFLGASADWGTVTPGLRADLLLLEGDPLADVAHAARPAGVMVRGRWLPRAELDRMLTEIGR
jgi:imidazolonepropionase-like amidohydrolase